MENNFTARILRDDKSDNDVDVNKENEIKDDVYTKSNETNVNEIEVDVKNENPSIDKKDVDNSIDNLKNEDEKKDVDYSNPDESIINNIDDVKEDSSEVTDTDNSVNADNDDDDVDDSTLLEYLNERYNKEYKDINDIFSEKTSDNIELSDSVKKFLEFEKETGRGIEDFVEFSKDLSKLSDDEKIIRYIKSENPNFDKEDLEFEMDEYTINDEYDDDRDKKRKKVERKKILSKANRYLNDYKEKYGTKLESNDVKIPDDYEELKFKLDDIRKKEEELNSVNQKNYDYFINESKKLFNKDFKGFEFDLSDKKQVYKPSDVDSVFKKQSDINNFIREHIDKNGRIKDVNKYHKSISMAMNPDKMAKYFYEQGATDALLKVKGKSENVGKNVRTSESKTNNTSGYSFKLTN